jgi:hypothetical protein
MSAESTTAANVENPPARGSRAARRPPVTHHAVILAMCLVAIVGAFALGINKTDHIATPWLGIPLPSVCQFRNLTGLDCPGCGLTRAFVCIAHGRFAEAWSYNAASVLVFAFVLIQIPWRTMQIWRLRTGRKELYLPRVTNIVVAIVVGAMFLQWIAKVIGYIF